jgi:hypothetical protein
MKMRRIHTEHTNGKAASHHRELCQRRAHAVGNPQCLETRSSDTWHFVLAGQAYRFLLITDPVTAAERHRRIAREAGPCDHIRYHADKLSGPGVMPRELCTEDQEGCT